jgi:hypothetical protein
VIYKQVIEDHKAKNLNGNEYFILTNKGVFCVNPEDNHEIVVLLYSIRAISNLNFPFIINEAEEFKVH